MSVELIGPLLFKRLVKPRLDRCFQGEDVCFQHWVTTSGGQRQYIDVSELLARADIACYAAKDDGRNQLSIYRATDQETRERHTELLRAASLKQAIENDELILFAQPIMRLCDIGTSVSHYEILLRLRDGENEPLTPGTFIPAAERYGLMPMIDQWVVRNTLEALNDIARPVDGHRFNINLSGHTLTDGAFQKMILQLLKETVIPAESLCFEITETAVISNLGRAGRFIRELRNLGCHIALDDFGCGLSSFSYLKQFPVDFIKIDGSFIKNIRCEETDRAIVKAINHVGHVCGVETVAECVEDVSLIEGLRELRIDYVQGHAGSPLSTSPTGSDCGCEPSGSRKINVTKCITPDLCDRSIQARLFGDIIWRQLAGLMRTSNNDQ